MVDPPFSVAWPTCNHISISTIGKYATDVDKVVFLTYLLYVHQAEAARRAGLAKSTVIDIKSAEADMQISYDEEGLNPPLI